jgi:hypothetical protein
LIVACFGSPGRPNPETVTPTLLSAVSWLMSLPHLESIADALRKGRLGCYSSQATALY